jgi:hypothetical protein
MRKADQDLRLRIVVEIGLTQRCAAWPERSRPQFQHSVN